MNDLSKVMTMKSFHKLIRIKRILYATIANFVTYMVIVQIEPVLAPHLIKEFGASQNIIGKCTCFVCNI